MECNAKPSRDVNIELLRLTACWMVIGLHVGFVDYYGKSMDIPVIFLHCLNVDSLSYFFAITGCFWFSKDKTFVTAAKQFLLRIFLPTSVCVLIMMIFAPYIDSPSHLPHLYLLQLPSLKVFLIGILTQNNIYWGVQFAHLWYIFRLGFLVLFYPLGNYLMRSPNGERVAIGIIAVRIILTFIDTIALIFPLFTETTANMSWFPSGFIFILTGHLMYHHRSRFTGRRYLFTGIFGLTGLLLLRLICQTAHYAHSGREASLIILNYNSVFSYFMVFFCFLAVFNIHPGKHLSRTIPALSKYTFYIYVFHLAVVNKLRAWGVLGRIKDWGHHFTPAFIGRVAATCAMILLVFVLTMVPAFIAKSIETKVRSVVRNAGTPQHS